MSGLLNAPEIRTALVGDFGGTNFRLGVVDLAGDPYAVRDPRKYVSRGYASPSAAIDAYLGDTGAPRPDAVVIAAAGPVKTGEIHLTNLDWTLSEAALVAEGFKLAHLINDYSAQALAAPLLDFDAAPLIGPPGAPMHDQTIAVLGAGTGFGVSALARDGLGEAVLATEGGHVAFAPVDAEEIEILQRLGARYPRVSVERILSGAGLCELHEVMSEIDGAPMRCADSKALTDRALAGEPMALRTVRRFCAVLGSVAGDVALTVGARGGVFIAGGIAPAIMPVLAASEFRERFEAKGRFEDYMRAIPTRVMVRHHVALQGAARALVRLIGSGPALSEGR